MVSFVLGVLASLIAATLFPSLADLVARLLAWLFRWLPLGRKVNLSGRWSSTWYVESQKFPQQNNNEDVVVRQFGKRFYARFRLGTIDFSARGEIDSGRYVTGTWKDNTEGGYHGAFQLVIDPNSRNMTGLWIGFSTTGVVKHGAWEWQRVPIA